MIGNKGADEQCTVADERHGRIYRCIKRVGHEKTKHDEEHVVDAPEYVTPPLDWHRLVGQAMPLLEWIAQHPELAGDERAEQALRLFVRYQIADTRGAPGAFALKPHVPIHEK